MHAESEVEAGAGARLTPEELAARERYHMQAQRKVDEFNRRCEERAARIRAGAARLREMCEDIELGRFQPADKPASAFFQRVELL